MTEIMKNHEAERIIENYSIENEKQIQNVLKYLLLIQNRKNFSEEFHLKILLSENFEKIPLSDIKKLINNPTRVEHFIQEFHL